MKRQRVVTPGFLLFVVLSGLILSSVAFYVGLNNYLTDGSVSTSTMLRCAVENVIVGNGIQDSIEQDKASLDEQTQLCEETLIKIEEDQFDPEFIQLYKQLNDTITAANETCNTQIASMTTVLMQLINGTNATADLVGTGTCQFNTLYPNQTTLATTAFNYKRLTLNDVEFYYYVFGESSEEIRVDDAGARIENCSPVIFKGTQVVKPLYVDAGGIVPSNYVQGMTIGNNAIEFIPFSGSFTNQTLKINEGFQVWINLF